MTNGKFLTQTASRLHDPEIVEAINHFRAKQGMKQLTDSYKQKYEVAVECNRRLKNKVARLEKSLKIRENEVKREIKTAKDFLRLLTTITDRDLKRAIVAMVYWDYFGFLGAHIIERLRAESSEFAAIMDTVGNIGTMASMKKVAGTKKLKDALILFGYGARGSVFRGAKSNSFAKDTRSEAAKSLSKNKKKGKTTKGEKK